MYKEARRISITLVYCMDGYYKSNYRESLVKIDQNDYNDNRGITRTLTVEYGLSVTATPSAIGGSL